MAIDHVAPGEVVSVRPLGPQLAESISTALFKSRQLEVMRIVLRAGQTVQEHHVAGEMTVQCLEGIAELVVDGCPQTLQPGQLMRVGYDMPYELHGVQDTSLLVTIALGGDGSAAVRQ